MAARLNRKHQDDVRAKIQSSQLINVLQRHVFEGTELKKSQVSAAIALLRKTLPDLTQVDAAVLTAHVTPRELSDAELTELVTSNDQQDGSGAGAVEQEICPALPAPVH
jgi:hypothetical protein